jgi:hypothetical protein
MLMARYAINLFYAGAIAYALWFTWTGIDFILSGLLI